MGNGTDGLTSAADGSWTHTRERLQVQTLTTVDVGARPRPIAVAVVDDHHAIRAGLEAAIASRPGLVCVGTASGIEQVAPLLYRARPDVVILDYHFPRSNGLRLCRQIRRDPVAPAVVIYSAYVDVSLVVPAMVAGAGALVDKGAPVRDLFEAIRTVAAGGSWLPLPIPELLSAARDALDAGDRALFDEIVSGGATPATVASGLGVTRSELDARIDEMVERLSPGVPVSSPAAKRGR
jgi:FixJ family two-component response regulator